MIKHTVVLAVMALCIATSQAGAAPFTVSYVDGGSWNTVYAQGFSPSLGATPNPGSAAGDTVYLDDFSFFKSGNADTAANIRLAILNNIFGDLTGLSTTNRNSSMRQAISSRRINLASSSTHSRSRATRTSGQTSIPFRSRRR